MERATNARQRTLDNLLWDIIQTLLRRSAVESVRQLTDWLQYDFPKYERRNKHTLRKDVAKAIARAAHYRRLKLAREDAIHGTPFDDVVAAAQARALEADQIKTTFKHLRELLVQTASELLVQLVELLVQLRPAPCLLSSVVALTRSAILKFESYQAALSSL
jgi:hypothetical protein